MALILHIETSTNVCSVALSLDGNILFSKIERKGLSHAALIGPFGDEALKVAQQHGLKIDAVAVSSGPGSYTGLRIGVSAAKGICYALHVPMIAVPTLALIVDMCVRTRNLPEKARIRPVLDARRMEVYTGLYGSDGSSLGPTEALVVMEDSFDKELSAGPVFFVGNGAKKLRTVLKSENAIFDEDLQPLAEAMMPLAEKAFSESLFVNVAYFEPFYLKEFVATVSKKHIIPGH